MTKAFKIIGYTLGALVALIIAAIIILPLVIDPNDFKPQIEAEAKKHTGRDLHLNGDLSLSVFPWLGIKLGATELGNAPGFGEQVFAKFDNAEVKVKLLPLLRKQVEVDEIALGNVFAQLEQRADGTNNWSDLAGAKASDAPTPAGSAMSVEVQVQSLTLDQIDVNLNDITGDPNNRVGSINLANSKITLRGEDGSTRQIENLKLTVRDVPLAKLVAVPIDLAFDVALSEPPLKAHVTLATKLSFDPTTQDAKLSALTIGADYQLNAPFIRGKTTLRSDIEMIAANQALTVRGLNINSDIELPDDKLKVQNSISGQVDFGLETQQISVAPLDIKATAFMPQLPTEGVPLTMTTKIGADLKAQTLKVESLDINAAGAIAQATVDGTTIIDNPQFAGTFKLNPLNLRDLLPKLGQAVPETADENVLRLVELNSSFRASTKDAHIDSLVAKLDDTQLNANASAANFAAPAIRFSVDVDQINVDRYLPPPAPDQDPQAATPATAAAAGAGELPLETLRALDVIGKASIGKLVASNATVTQLNVNLKAKEGLIALHPLTANLYEGKYAGNVQLDARGEILKITLNESLKGISAGPLLKDVVGEDRLSGKGDFTMKLSAAGTTPEWITKTLSGDVGIAFKDGAVKGINVGQMARQVQARLGNRSAAASAEVEKTDFSELTASFQLDKGIARNQDLSLKSPLLRVVGNGSADLPQSQIDYLITATIAGTSKGQGGRELDDLKGLPIPVRITGPFADPKFDIQYDEILKARAKQSFDREKAKQKEKIDEKKEELKQDLKEEKQEIKEQAEEKLKEKFKGLFGK